MCIRDRFPADDLYPSDTLFPLAGGEADVVIENDRIVNESVSFRQSICDSGDIIFGKCNAAELVFKCADVNNPVSYTHLDVYKRQVWFLLVHG